MALSPINVLGLQNSLQVAAEVGAKYVFASSSSVYGDDDRQPFHEDQMRSRPESPYGATKVAGEALVHAHHATTGLPVAIARFFTVFGPRQRPDLAIRKFALKILKGEPIELYGEGKPLRDYTYVDDIVDGFVRLGACPDPYLLVNLGSHRPFAVAELVDAMERIFGNRSDTRDEAHAARRCAGHLRGYHSCARASRLGAAHVARSRTDIVP